MSLFFVSISEYELNKEQNVISTFTKGRANTSLRPFEISR